MKDKDKHKKTSLHAVQNENHKLDKKSDKMRKRDRDRDNNIKNANVESKADQRVS